MFLKTIKMEYNKNKTPKMEYNGYYIQELIPNKKYFIVESNEYIQTYISSKSTLCDAKKFIDEELNQI